MGYRAVGKTSVARELARRTGRPWIDLDAMIEQRLGGTIADYFASHGEVAFREVETQTLTRVLNELERPTIVSLGGGAVLRDVNRQLLKRHGTRIWLSAEVATICQRLAADEKTAGQRPSLTGGDVIGEVQSVLDVRTPIYRQLADLTVAVDQTTVQDIAENILKGIST